MRIGIVTQPLEMNYGGIIQNWALQQALKQLGHDPVTLDAFQKFSTPHYVFNCCRTLLRRACGKKASFPQRYHGALRWRLTGEFIEEHIATTRVMWDYERSAVKRYGLEGIVVGSDQVWRAAYNGTHIADMFLKFAQGLPLRRVAYAASFGVDNWEYTPEQESQCVPLARQFDAISVRESSGVALCRDHLGMEAQHVLDPTMLLTAGDYGPIIDPDWDCSEPYLAVYCLDVTDAKRAFFNQLAADRGLKVRYFSAGWGGRLTVGQWLAMISNAAMVVTDSFHGTVFSILFHTPFVSLVNEKRGASRFNALLSCLDLQERTSQACANVAIDWVGVDTKLSQLRRESLGFLQENLK